MRAICKPLAFRSPENRRSISRVTLRRATRRRLLRHPKNQLPKKKKQKKGPKKMASFADSFAQPGTDSAAAGSTRSFDDNYFGYDSLGDSPIFHNSSPPSFASPAAAAGDVFAPQPETPSPPSIYSSGGGFAADPEDFAPFSSEANGKAVDGGFGAPDGPILPHPSEMQADEGFALREWRRQNAILLQEKEKREKELRNEIIDEADEYKADFYRRRKLTCETNQTTNREKEKLFLSSKEKFHAEADKNYWKTIAELIPHEVPTIEKRRGKKDQDKKPSIIVVQGPKPGKPTDLSRMRQILVKLKHNTPPHLKPSLPAAPAQAKDAKSPGPAATNAPPKAASVSTAPEALVVA